MFQLIQQHLPPAGQILLMKLFLEQHSNPLTDEEFFSYTGPYWVRTRYAACRADRWDIAKEILLCWSELITPENGERFLGCALVVIAERLSTNPVVKIHEVAEFGSLESKLVEAQAPQGFRTDALSMFQFFYDREIRPS